VRESELLFRRLPAARLAAAYGQVPQAWVGGSGWVAVGWVAEKALIFGNGLFSNGGMPNLGFDVPWALCIHFMFLQCIFFCGG
jgi:hypothetical protein